MSEESIWRHLRSAGLSEAGTAGVMGNLMAESLLCSNNVENRCSKSDEQYTAEVDSGRIDRREFLGDAYGYGLAQWTFYTRKSALYDFAKSRGCSISDEAMQLDYLLFELRNEYADLLNYLKSSGSILTATSKFCTEFERPAVANISTRYQFAQGFYNRHAGTPVDASDAPKKAVYETMSTPMPVIARGSKGLAAGMVQWLLTKHGYDIVADCDFGAKSEAALKAFMEKRGKTNVTKVTPDVWAALYE